MIVFGGHDPLWRDDTWEFKLEGNSGWDRIDTRGDPPSAHFPQAVYDPVRDRMLVLFGFVGETPTPETAVWSLSLSGQPTWKRLALAGDAPQSGEAVYDAIRDRILVFSGFSDTVRAGVYALDFQGEDAARWSQLQVQLPSALRRTGVSLIHDVVRDRLLLFGGGLRARGSFESPYAPMNDTWELPLANPLEWHKLSPSGDLPIRRLDAFAVFDERRDRMVIWNGSPEPGYSTYLGDGWTLSLGEHPAWTKLSADLHPAPERGSQIYDPDRERMVIFGGVVYQPAALSYGPVIPTARSLALKDGKEWEILYPTDSAPEFERGQTFTYDPVGRRFVLLGGFRSAPDVVWTYELRGQGVWRAVTATGEIPPQRLSHTAIYDSGSKSIVMFGGSLPRSNDTWRLSLGDQLTWTRLTPLGEPPSPRSQPRSVYDPLGGRMIVYGGVTDAGPVNDVWELSLASGLRWTPRSPAGTPPAPDIPPAFVYDSNRHRALLVGQDVWALDLDPELRWEREDGPPGPFVTGNSASFDAGADRVLAIVTGHECQPWTLDLSPTVAWRQVPVTGDTPSSRGPAAIGFEPEGTRAFVFGNDFSYRFSDLWRLEMTGGTRAAGDLRPGSDIPGPVALALSLAAPHPNPSAGPMSFSFTLPRDSYVSLRVFDTAGRLVISLFNGMSTAGSREVVWDGRDALGATVRPGLYFCRLTAGDRSETKQVVFLGR